MKIKGEIGLKKRRRKINMMYIHGSSSVASDVGGENEEKN